MKIILTYSQLWRTCAVGLCALLPTAAIYGLDFAADKLHGQAPWYDLSLATLALLSIPLVAISSSIGLTYNDDLKVRLEGYDLHLAAEKLTAIEPPITAT